MLSLSVSQKIFKLGDLEIIVFYFLMFLYYFRLKEQLQDLILYLNIENYGRCNYIIVY